MNPKIFGVLCILVLIAGIGSFALEHSAYAQPKTKLALQKEASAKYLEKMAKHENGVSKMQKLMEQVSKIKNDNSKINKSKR